VGDRQADRALAAALKPAGVLRIQERARPYPQRSDGGMSGQGGVRRLTVWRSCWEGGSVEDTADVVSLLEAGAALLGLVL
jgi:hypothetical protein